MNEGWTKFCQENVIECCIDENHGIPSWCFAANSHQRDQASLYSKSERRLHVSQFFMCATKKIQEKAQYFVLEKRHHCSLKNRLKSDSVHDMSVARAGESLIRIVRGCHEGCHEF